MTAISWIVLIMIVGGAIITATLKYKEHKYFKDMEKKSHG